MTNLQKLKNFKKELVRKLVTEYKNKIKISELDAPVPIICEENKDQIFNELSGTNLKTMDVNMLVKKDENRLSLHPTVHLSTERYVQDGINNDNNVRRQSNHKKPDKGSKLPTT